LILTSYLIKRIQPTPTRGELLMRKIDDLRARIAKPSIQGTGPGKQNERFIFLLVQKTEHPEETYFRASDFMRGLDIEDMNSFSQDSRFSNICEMRC